MGKERHARDTARQDHGTKPSRVAPDKSAGTGPIAETAGGSDGTPPAAGPGRSYTASAGPDGAAEPVPAIASGTGCASRARATQSAAGTSSPSGAIRPTAGETDRTRNTRTAYPAARSDPASAAFGPVHKTQTGADPAPRPGAAWPPDNLWLCNYVGTTASTGHTPNGADCTLCAIVDASSATAGACRDVAGSDAGESA